MEEALKIFVIIASTREGRFGHKPAAWIFEELKKHANVSAELIDLRDWPLPFFDQPMNPSIKDKPYPYEIVERWSAKVAEPDGFIIVTPEYNHGYPAVLKNALDWVFREWADKPVGFAGYGNAGGARSIEQLRQVAVELQMVPIRLAIHLPTEVFRAARTAPEPVDPAIFSPVAERAQAFLDQLLRYAEALRAMRQRAAK